MATATPSCRKPTRRRKRKRLPGTFLRAVRYTSSRRSRLSAVCSCPQEIPPLPIRQQQGQQQIDCGRTMSPAQSGRIQSTNWRKNRLMIPSIVVNRPRRFKGYHVGGLIIVRRQKRPPDCLGWSSVWVLDVHRRDDRGKLPSRSTQPRTTRGTHLAEPRTGEWIP